MLVIGRYTILLRLLQYLFSLLANAMCGMCTCLTLKRYWNERYSNGVVYLSYMETCDGEEEGDGGG